MVNSEVVAREMRFDLLEKGQKTEREGPRKGYTRPKRP